jgi:chromosome segregation ATPase
MVEPLLTIAAELERRDQRVADELARVEREQAELDELRTSGAAARTFLAELPARIAAFERAEERAAEQLAAAEAALAAAADEQRAAAEASVAAREADVTRAREHVAALEAEGVAYRDEAERLCARAGVADLDGLLALASHRRGALLVEHSSLAREREAVVREASELLASVLGEPMALTSVRGLRERLP